MTIQIHIEQSYDWWLSLAYFYCGISMEEREQMSSMMKWINNDIAIIKMCTGIRFVPQLRNTEQTAQRAEVSCVKQKTTSQLTSAMQAEPAEFCLH